MDADFLTVREVAERLRITPKRAYVVLASGKTCPVTHVGRRVLVPREAWNRWYARHVEHAMAACEDSSRAQGGSALEQEEVQPES